MPNNALYGVWLVGEGWYKFHGDPIVGDAELAQSLCVILRAGNVQRIDPSLVAAEGDLLAREEYAMTEYKPRPRRPFWQFWRK